jgi:hypothetical protein
MMIEMAGHERNIDVASFPDGFAVIDRFKNGEQARMFLDLPSNGV